MRKPWERHEADLVALLGLRQTITSGNKFYDQGDAVTPGRKDPFPLYVDCKHTVKASATVRLKDLDQWQEQAAILGKRFLLALRFETPVGEGDYVLLSLHDLKELLDMARTEPKTVEAP